MPANRSLEFAHLAARALSPSYRRLWEGQAAHYAGLAEPAESPPACVPLAPAFRLPAESAACVPCGAASAWARLLNALGVAWEYDIRFWLPERATWLKVLSQPPAEAPTACTQATEGELAAARALAADGSRVYMISGWPRRKGFGVWVVAEAGEFMVVRADFRDLALANLLGVNFGRLYEGMKGVRGE